MENQIQLCTLLPPFPPIPIEILMRILCVHDFQHFKGRTLTTASGNGYCFGRVINEDNGILFQAQRFVIPGQELSIQRARKVEREYFQAFEDIEEAYKTPEAMLTLNLGSDEGRPVYGINVFIRVNFLDERTSHEVRSMEIVGELHHVLPFLEVARDNLYVYVITPTYEPIYDHIMYHFPEGPVSEMMCRSLARDVLTGLSNVHLRNMLLYHGGLDLDNILVVGSGNDKRYVIAHFWNCILSIDEFPNRIGLLPGRLHGGRSYLMSLQIFNAENFHGETSDLWRLGLLLLCLFLRRPFYNDPSTGYQGIKTITDFNLLRNFLYQRNLDLSDECVEFLFMCFTTNSGVYRTCDELLRSRWLA